MISRQIIRVIDKCGSNGKKKKDKVFRVTLSSLYLQEALYSYRLELSALLSTRVGPQHLTHRHLVLLGP